MTQSDFHLNPFCSLNIFIANIKQGVGPQVFPTLVTAIPLQTYIQKSVNNGEHVSIDVRIEAFFETR